MSFYYNIIDSARRKLCRIQYSKNIPVTHNNFRREFQRYILSRISRMKRKSLIPYLSALIVVQQNSYDEFRFIVSRQGCESRRQTLSSISRPRFRDFGKVSALSRSLTLLGKKVSTRSRPLFGFSRPKMDEKK